MSDEMGLDVERSLCKNAPFSVPAYARAHIHSPSTCHSGRLHSDTILDIPIRPSLSRFHGGDGTLLLVLTPMLQFDVHKRKTKRSGLKCSECIVRGIREAYERTC